MASEVCRRCRPSTRHRSADSDPHVSGTQSALPVAPGSRSDTGKRFRFPAARLRIADTALATVLPKPRPLDREPPAGSGDHILLPPCVPIFADGLWVDEARTVQLDVCQLAGPLPKHAASVHSPPSALQSAALVERSVPNRLPHARLTASGFSITTLFKKGSSR
jgi:hypothetical protein